MSGWDLHVSGDVFIPNLLVKMYESHASSEIAFSSSALKYVKMSLSGGCLRVSEGVWIITGGV